MIIEKYKGEVEWKKKNKIKFKNSNSACNYFYYNNGWIYNNDDKYKQETISK